MAVVDTSRSSPLPLSSSPDTSSIGVAAGWRMIASCIVLPHTFLKSLHGAATYYTGLPLCHLIVNQHERGCTLFNLATFLCVMVGTLREQVVLKHSKYRH